MDRQHHKPVKFEPLEPQRRIIAHLNQHDEALLFVGMGVGKTAACLRAIRNMIVDGEIRSALIVAPLRVCALTWPLEIMQWDEFRDLSVANLRSPQGMSCFRKGKADIYLINYESLPRLCEVVRQLKKVPFDLIVWDESTKAKSHASKRINDFRRSVPRVKKHWALTGTPAPNSMLDLFAQVRLIDDGKRLGKSFTAYQDRYFTSDYMGYKWTIREGADTEIHEKIKDLTLTLKSADWVDIPEPVVSDIEIEMTRAQENDYKAFVRDMVLQIIGKDVEITAANAAALTSKLLQFSSGAIYDSEKDWHQVNSLKLDALAVLRRKLTSPLLVACGFRHEQDRIRAAFDDAEFFADAKTQAQQTDMLKRWNAGKIKMLVAHPASVGHGLNLQGGGKDICWFTLTYVPEHYQQMNCRLIRRGQKDKVTIHRLIVEGTMDEVVASVLLEKEGAENRLLNALKNLEALRG